LSELPAPLDARDCVPSRAPHVYESGVRPRAGFRQVLLAFVDSGNQHCEQGYSHERLERGVAGKLFEKAIRRLVRFEPFVYERALLGSVQFVYAEAHYAVQPRPRDMVTRREYDLQIGNAIDGGSRQADNLLLPTVVGNLVQSVEVQADFGVALRRLN